MKKTTLLAMAFSACFSPLFAQTTWFQPDDKWFFHHVGGWSGEGRELLKVKGDSTIDGKTFKKITRKVALNSGGIWDSQRFLRQDGRKIFCLGDFSGTEFLMYDFDLEVGKKVFIPLDFGQPGFGYEIVEKTTVDVCGQPRAAQKVVWLGPGIASSAEKGMIIEGLGCVEGLHLIAGEWCATSSYLFLDEPDALASDGIRRTFCSFESAGGCDFEGLAASLCAVSGSTETTVPSLKIWPNPSAGEVFFEAQNAAEIQKIELFDATGRLVKSENAPSGRAFSTDFRGAGFLKIWTEKGSAMARAVFF